MNKNKVISAGILLEHKGKFLIGHPTELTGTTHGWGILKGRQDANETLVQTAFREFKEESNLDLILTPGVICTPRPFYKYTVSSKKQVYVFWAVDPYGYTTQHNFSCPSLVPNTDKPEIDKYKWVTADEAVDLVVESQKGLFRFVQQLIKPDLKFYGQ